MQKAISEILDYLYLGKQQDALVESELLEFGITHILNVSDSSKYHQESKINRKHIPVSDFGETKIDKILDDCCNFIEIARKSSGKVLLHCRRGQNRSPSIAVAYLMKIHQMKLAEAFFHVRKRRPQFAPHEQYFAQLQNIERSLFGEITLTEDDEPLSIQAISKKIAEEIKSKE